MSKDITTGQFVEQGNAGGSRLGKPNKLKRESLLKLCEDSGYKPEEAMLEIAKGELVCLTCYGACETRYVTVDENGSRQRDEQGNLKFNVRLCESCLGTGRERMHVADVLKARTSIFDKIVPSLKQIDHSNDDGSLRPGWTMVFPKVMDLKPGSGKTPPMLQQKRDE
jgi:hypothetical protein